MNHLEPIRIFSVQVAHALVVGLPAQGTTRGERKIRISGEVVFGDPEEGVGERVFFPPVLPFRHGVVPDHARHRGVWVTLHPDKTGFRKGGGQLFKQPDIGMAFVEIETVGRFNLLPLVCFFEFWPKLPLSGKIKSHCLGESKHWVDLDGCADLGVIGEGVADPVGSGATGADDEELTFAVVEEIKHL